MPKYAVSVVVEASGELGTHYLDVFDDALGVANAIRDIDPAWSGDFDEYIEVLDKWGNIYHMIVKEVV